MCDADEATGKPRNHLVTVAWHVKRSFLQGHHLVYSERGPAHSQPRLHCGLPRSTNYALTADGLIDVQNALKEDYQPGAVWGMKRTTFGAALQLKGNDNYFFSPVLLRDGQASMQLLGKPVVFMDDMPAVAANALSVVYADFSSFYTILDRVGLQVLRDPYTNKGFVTYYTTQRVGGDVTSFDAGVIGKVAS